MLCHLRSYKALPLVVHAFSTYEASTSCASHSEHHFSNLDIFNSLVSSHSVPYKILKISIETTKYTKKLFKYMIDTLANLYTALKS